MDPDDDNTIPDSLNDELKEKIVALMNTRVLLFQHQIELENLRIESVLHPSPESTKRAKDYAEERVKPIETEIQHLAGEVARMAFDPTKLKNLLGMWSADLTRFLDLGLITNALGVDTSKITSAFDDLKDIFRDGL
jgi:hypothetical protein